MQPHLAGTSAPLFVYHPKPCIRCGSVFQPNGANAKWCPTCKSEAVRERLRKHSRLFRARHPEKVKEDKRLYRQRLRDRKAVLRFGLGTYRAKAAAQALSDLYGAGTAA